MSREIEIQNFEKEFVNFFTYCKKQKFNKNELKEILKPLQKLVVKKFFKKLALVIFILIVLMSACKFIDTMSWSLSAFGRLLLIRILSIWDWMYLYNAKCLISANVNKQGSSSGINGYNALMKLGKYETEPNNCELCANFDRIDVIRNTTFSFIHKNYLEKGLPILINDSHPPKKFNEFAKILYDTSNFVNSNPCDVETNLLVNRLININNLLEKSLENNNENENMNYDDSKDKPWFFHLRNCHFSAVKASRKFIPKPYFSPSHLGPYYSSWVLMSKNYKQLTKELYVDGIIIVQQMTGKMLVTLIAKKPCEKICGEHSFIINEGESIVFTTDLWIFVYMLDNFDESAATITETRWN